MQAVTPFKALVVAELSVRQLEALDPDVIVPMHCTGAPFISLLRERMPDKVVQSNAGSRFTLGA